MLTGDSRTFHYVDPEGTSADASFTCDQDGGCHGLATDADGESYVLEYCGSQGHVWKRPNTESLDKEDEPVWSGLDTSNLDKEDEDIEDTTTVAIYSIKFYYTAAFAKDTPDIDGFIKQAVARTNLAYLNSGVPLGAFALCAEAAPSIREVGDGYKTIEAFSKMKGSPKALRDTADTAVLLVKSLDVCGIGNLGAIPDGTTFSVVEKTCGQNGFTLAHEIGHNFGLAHDRANARKLIYPYGTGHLIDQGRSRNRLGFRTIMAYGAPGHLNQVNYFSNPDIIYPWTGTPTGTTKSNNARVLMNNRFKMAALGDESSSTCRKTRPPNFSNYDDSNENSDEYGIVKDQSDID